MALNLSKLWDFANSLLETGEAFVENQVEVIYGALSLWLDGQVARTSTKFDDTAKQIVELGIRDKLLKKYPLNQFPLD